MISSLMKFISESTDTPMEPLIERHLDKNGNKLDMGKFRRYIRSRKPRSKAYNGPFVFVNNAIIEQAKHIIAHNKDTSYEEAIQFSYCNIMEHYITELWNRTKQMYEIDKQFAEDLFQTEADLIPFEAFAHLPYNTFCIDYDFSVHGMRCEGLVVDVYIDGKIVAVTAVGVFDGGKHGLFTNEYDFRKGMMCKVNEDPDKKNRDPVPMPEVNAIWNIICQLCMFLSQPKPDDVVKAKPSSNHGKKKQKVKDVSKWEVGFRYGQAIKNMVKPKTESTTTHLTGKTHASPKPHVRKAHWQHYHVGKGRKQIVTKWISPVLVNINTGNDIITTCHK